MDDAQQIVRIIGLELMPVLLTLARSGNAASATAPSQNSASLEADDYAAIDDARMDAIDQRIAAVLQKLSVAEQRALLVLAWIGNGTFDAPDWATALGAARQADPAEASLVDQLMDMPMLVDYLEAGLEALAIPRG